MNIPDLTGYLLEDARRILEAAGVRYETSVTTSPRDDTGGEELRVARTLIVNDEVLLTLCKY